MDMSAFASSKTAIVPINCSEEEGNEKASGLMETRGPGESWPSPLKGSLRISHHFMLTISSN